MFVLADLKNRGMADDFFGRSRGWDPGRFRPSMARRSPEVTELHSQPAVARGGVAPQDSSVMKYLPFRSRVLLAHKSREEQHRTAGRWFATTACAIPASFRVTESARPRRSPLEREPDD